MASTSAGDASKLTPSLTRRLFLPIILLQSLLQVFKREKSIRVLDDPKAVPVDIYETFVNKLGHICESTKGGSMVTAFAILQLGVIQYYFTSNDRKEVDYEWTSDYITDILNTLGSATNEEVDRRTPNSTPSAVFQSLLQKILRFNLSRIKGYIFGMKNALGFCISFARGDSSEDAPMMLENLERLQTLLQFAGEVSDLEFVDGSQAVIQALDTMYTPHFKEYLHLRTQNNNDRKAPWVVVGHSIGRLLSYYYDVDILSSARRRWPQLFEDFEVHWIPSAPSYTPNVRRAKLDAAMIIGKMWNEPLKSEYTKYAARLENSGISLNAEVSRTAHDFKTSVHAEVNLHAHVLRLIRGQAGQDVPVFFNGIKYIGCSKPTCRLCELWFDNHPSRVRVRGGHKNLYHEWRAADVDEQVAANVRDATLNRMIPLIRDQVAADLRDRCATRSPNDSNDVPTNLPLTCTGTDVFSTRSMDDDLVSTMGRMALEDVEERGEEVVAWGEEAASTPNNSDSRVTDEVAVVASVEVDEDDDHGGGAKL
ncbi:hypothetical protein B0T18DRAFT_413660 [Schizothecium vesticola]|uniref:Uncharacterized protein n=1 Tax=Schizothecium vesticola TaxID=314040 RepID=A0AA40ENU1_9PEZI|nr:hypothetical protein B0T18DRAFT_413660 [Schizothecium vesticola]